MKRLREGIPSIQGGNMDDRAQYAFGAELVEVRVHSRTREIRVPRIVAAFGAGKIVSPTTAQGQFIGGLV